MSGNTIVDAALSRINAETTRANGFKDAFLQLHGRGPVEPDSDDFVRHFFPELKEQFGRTGWVNSAKHLPRTHLLLFAPPHVLDIYPVPIEEFRSRHGLTFESVEFLVENNLAVPNLYFRKEEYWKQQKDWSKLSYLKPLIESSFVTGARSDAYFDAVSAEYGTPHQNETLIRSALEHIREKNNEEFLKVMRKDVVGKDENGIKEAIENRVTREAIRLQHVEVFSKPRAGQLRSFNS